jgi:hypothetical protein
LDWGSLSWLEEAEWVEGGDVGDVEENGEEDGVVEAMNRCW